MLSSRSWNGIYYHRGERYVGGDDMRPERHKGGNRLTSAFAAVLRQESHFGGGAQQHRRPQLQTYQTPPEDSAIWLTRLVIELETKCQPSTSHAGRTAVKEESESNA